jgi:hypothetical protein
MTNGTRNSDELKFGSANCNNSFSNWLTNAWLDNCVNFGSVNGEQGPYHYFHRA